MLRLITLCLTALLLSACDPVAEPSKHPEQVAPVSVALPASDPVWTAEHDRYLGTNVQPSDPLEAIMWRGVRCDYLGSEIGGDNSAQDRAIQKRMNELRCGDDLLTEARTLRLARATDPAAVVRLDALIARW